MANYGTLKAAIDAYIKRNGQQRITGDLLNAVLNAAVDALGMGYQFLGIATAQTDPGTPDARVFYLAGAGTYPNFGSTEIPDGGIGIFCYGDTWEYEVLQVGSENAVLYTPQTPTTEQKAQARSNIGAGTGNYSKPGTGIPKTDLAEGVQTSLGKADTAYQLPASGIPSTDLASPIRASLGKAESAVQPRDIEPIVDVIPSQASESNKLADKNFVNSSIATNTAYYISDNGQPFSSLADLEAYSGTLTNNDYAFVVGTDAAGNTTYTRYKYNASTQEWAEEYVLNNSSFTAEQWAAISSGITALLVQKLTDLPTEVITYVSQTLTEAQKAQARQNIGATAPEIFWATYGTTTVAEIDAAVTAGKQVLIFDGGWVYAYAGKDTGYHYFFAIVGNITYRRIRVQISTGGWTSHAISVQGTANRVQTIAGNETDEAKYPSTKAVADALGKWGVISQTQAWANDYGSYTISNVVRGLIPQSFIDAWNHLVMSFGTFNETTGYFELNGLTDISYKEALVIKEKYTLGIQAEGWRPNSYQYSELEIFSARTSIPIRTVGPVYPYLTWNTHIEVARFGISNSDYPGTFLGYGCYRLKRILDIIKNTAAINLPLFHALEECYFKISNNFSAPDSKFLSLASVVYLVDNATNGSNPITITLHATAYARCQADTTEYTYNEQTYTGIIAYAAAKNITITSA